MKVYRSVLFLTVFAFMFIGIILVAASPVYGIGHTVSEDGQLLKLISPAQNAESSYPFPNFRWDEHPAAFKNVAQPVSYKIQISSDKNFNTIIDSDIVCLNRYVHDHPFAPGNYYWRVSAVPYEKSQTPWSMPQSFNISPFAEEILIKQSNSSEDDTQRIKDAVVRAMNTAKKGQPVKIKFSPGNYRIGKSLHGPLIDLTGVSNVLIDGTGAKIQFSTHKQGLIRAAQCEKIAVRGFSSSYDKGALRVQGYVKAVDYDTCKVTVSIEPGYPDFTASDSPAHDIFYLLEPGSKGRLKTDTPNFFRADGGFNKNADGTWSFKLSRSSENWKVGDRYSFNFRGGSVQFVDFGESCSVSAYDLKTGGWGGMQFVAKEGDLFNILNCSTPFDEGKWMTGNADGVHIRGHKIGPWIEGLKIQAIGDDAIALYARPASIKSLTDSSRTVICKREFFNLEAGDEVSFFQPLKGAVLLETSVATVLPVENGYKVTFSDALPKGLKLDGPLVEATQIWNRSKSCGDFMVRDSKFTNIRRYGTVFRSKRGVVENNTYTGTSTRSIVFINGTQWPNGLYASDIIVRNNTIIDSGFDSPSQPAAIAFIFNGYKRSATTIGPRKLLIEGNTIENCPAPEIHLAWVENAVLRNNRRRETNGHWTPASYTASNSTEIVNRERMGILPVNEPVTDLVTPVMTDEAPAAGKRVRQVAPEYEGTQVYHALYLPVDWRPGSTYPVIVEYTGNIFPPGKGSGEIKDANLGYGMSGGRGFIWVAMPYVEKGLKMNAVKWWGDKQATVDYCKVNLPRICKAFGGDPNNVFVCGFSRGAIGSSYIGLADNEIAALWKGVFTHDHFDGQLETWGYPECDRKSALKRLARLKGRPVLVCGQNTSNLRSKFLDHHLDLARFTFLDVPVHNIFNIPEGKVYHSHTDMWMHRESKYRQQAHAWLQNRIKEK